jgi:hypothetical protein
MAVTLLLSPGKDADRETAIERYTHVVDDAADELRLQTVSVSPAFDSDTADDGIVTRDREAKDSARMLVA